MIPAVLTHCAGIDIGKRGLAVCLMIGAAEAEPKVEVREFSTFTADIEAMKAWLVQAGCTHVVMESTGSYWKPVLNVLEGSLAVCLANPVDVKGRKGHKTDRKDAKWLAHLLRHDMIRASFVPPRAIREMRDLTRRRPAIVLRGPVYEHARFSADKKSIEVRERMVCRHRAHEEDRPFPPPAPRVDPQLLPGSKASSGVVEGLNKKAKVTMRKSYGFRTYRVLELGKRLVNHRRSGAEVMLVTAGFAVQA